MPASGTRQTTQDSWLEVTGGALRAGDITYECLGVGSAFGYTVEVAFRNDPSSPRVQGRLVRDGEDLDAFDREFWRAMTGEQRVEALWGMVLDMLAIKGELGDDEPRLQRSVGRILRS